MDLNKPVLSYSNISAWNRCHKWWEYAYIEDLTPIGKAAFELQVGDLVHKMLDAYYRGQFKSDDIKYLQERVQEYYPENTPIESLDTAYEAARLVKCYITKFERDHLMVISPEVHLEYDFGEFILYSRVDALCKTPDLKAWRMEHKTMKRMDTGYLKGYRRGLQTGIAHLLIDKVMDEKVYGTIFNLLIKTTIPDCERAPYPKEKWMLKIALEAAKGCVRGIQRGDFYPSAECVRYNKTCEYAPLCKADTPNTRAALYTSREEVKQKSRGFVWEDFEP